VSERESKETGARAIWKGKERNGKAGKESKERKGKQGKERKGACAMEAGRPP
jgi:hypothetical protein